MAVKIINFANFDHSYREEVKKLFDREKQVSIAIQENNSLCFLAEVFGAFETETKGYILHEFLEGFTLENLLDKEDFELTE